MSDLAVILLLARHGQTDLNAQNKFRAWADPPLNKTGIAEAKDMATVFDPIQLTRIVTDDLKRTKQTAHIIAATVGLEVEIDSDLRPWNLGDLAGEDKDENSEVLDDLIENPDKQTPGKSSESLNEFGARNGAAIRQYLRDAESKGPYLLVVHSSNVVNLIEGEKPEQSELVGPGDIMAIAGSEADGYVMTALECCFDDGGLSVSKIANEAVSEESAEHSPRPWRVLTMRGVTKIYDALDRIVIHSCEIEEKLIPLSRNNAELIVRAVNAFQ